MKFVVLLLFISAHSIQYTNAQHCKVYLKNSSNYFLEPNYDKDDCLSEDKDFKYSWSGLSKDNKLQGYGTLSCYDVETNKLLSTETVTFSEGYRTGASYEKLINEAGTTESTTSANYKNGLRNGNVHIYHNRDNLNGTYSFYCLDDKFDESKIIKFVQKEYIDGPSGLSYYNCLYEGFYDKKKNVFKGVLKIDNNIFFDGEFWASGDGFPLINYNGLKLFFKNGYAHYSNSIKVYCDNYNYGLLNGYGIVYFPNGDVIISNEFKDGNLNGFGSYKWASGKKYVGTFDNLKITSKGTFFDEQGKSEYGKFPSISTNQSNNLVNAAIIGLTAYGIYKILSPENNKIESKEIINSSTTSTNKNLESTKEASSTKVNVEKKYYSFQFEKDWQIDNKGIYQNTLLIFKNNLKVNSPPVSYYYHSNNSGSITFSIHYGLSYMKELYVSEGSIIEQRTKFIKEFIKKHIDSDAIF